MRTIIVVLCLPAVCAAVACVWLVVRDLVHSSRLTRADAQDKLRRVLDGTMPWCEWDYFTHVPLKTDPLLDEIRKACLDMWTDDNLARDARGAVDGKWMYDERCRERIRGLLLGLEASGNPASPHNA